MIKYDEWKRLAESDPEKLFTERHAHPYIPIAVKLNMINVATKGFIDKDEKGSEYHVGPVCIDYDETGFATVNTVKKALYLMQIYLTAYFSVDFDGEEFDTRQYDEIVQKSCQSRINRLADKGSTSYIKRQAIELQNDFKTFEKMLNKELADELARNNDPCKRMRPFAGDLIEAVLDRINMDISPEKLKQATEELSRLTEEVKQRQAKLQLVKDE